MSSNYSHFPKLLTPFPTPLPFAQVPQPTSSLRSPGSFSPGACLSESQLSIKLWLKCCLTFPQTPIHIQMCLLCIFICFAYMKTVTLTSLAIPVHDLHSAFIWGSQQKLLACDYKPSKTLGTMATGYYYIQEPCCNLLHHSIDVEHLVFHFFHYYNQRCNNNTINGLFMTLQISWRPFEN